MAKRRKTMNKKVKVFLVVTLLLAIVGILAYFYLSKDSSNEVVNSIKSGVEKIKEEVKPVKKVQVIDVNDNTRPYAVMINNNSAVWKYQSGLNDAYIVYELLVEGGITREMALFKNKDVSKIQSIRSARHYYLDYALENDAIYVHWGWSPQAQSDISSLKINNLNGLYYENSYFFRDSEVKAAYEHRGYTSTELIKKGVEKLKYRTTTESEPLLKYEVDPIDLSKYEGVKDASEVAIKFSGYQTTKFTYDEGTKLYNKTQNSTEMYEFASGKRMTAKNIITYQISYSNISGDAKGRLNANNIGSGDGYFISEGKAVPITWEKTSRSSKTVYKYKDGTPLVVNDGNTYIEIQPKGQTLSITGSSDKDTQNAE